MSWLPCQHFRAYAKEREVYLRLSYSRVKHWVRITFRLSTSFGETAPADEQEDKVRSSRYYAEAKGRRWIVPLTVGMLLQCSKLGSRGVQRRYDPAEMIEMLQALFDRQVMVELGRSRIGGKEEKDGNQEKRSNPLVSNVRYLSNMYPSWQVRRSLRYGAQLSLQKRRSDMDSLTCPMGHVIMYMLAQAVHAVMTSCRGSINIVD